VVVSSEIECMRVCVCFLYFVAMSREPVYNSCERIPFSVTASDNGDG